MPIGNTATRPETEIAEDVIRVFGDASSTHEEREAAEFLVRRWAAKVDKQKRRKVKTK